MFWFFKACELEDDKNVDQYNPNHVYNIPDTLKVALEWPGHLQYLIYKENTVQYQDKYFISSRLKFLEQSK